MLWFRQAACLDQLWRALPNASRRLRSRLRRCDTSFLNTPALPLLPVAPDLRRLSRQLNQCQPPQNPNLLRVGEIEGAHARHDATPSRSAKDPGLGSGTSEIFMNSQAERGGAQVLLPLDHPASSLSLFPSRLPLGAEESEFMDPHGPTIVPRCPTAVIADKIKHIHFQKESKNIFLPTWQAIPARGYVNVGNDYGKTRLYTAIRSKTTALLRCAHHHSTQRERLSPPCRDDESVVKRSHRNRSSSPDESGFYSRYFLVPKKDGGLRLILDLRLLNYALMKRLFRMITLKQILPQICPGDWFMSLDLKDAYFHIQVAPYHRQFLIFAFEGVAYQYKVLPFGLSMAPRTFTGDAWSFVTRCMDAVTIQHHAASFKEGTALPLKAFQKMLGHMAAALPVLKLGLLHMRPIHFWLMQRAPSAAWRHRHHRVTVTRACVSVLDHWGDPFWIKRGMILDTAHRRKVVTTDASNKDWGELCEGKPTFGLWFEEESGLHINCLEMLAVCQACQFFLLDIRGHHVLARYSRSVVSYINHQGALVSKRLHSGEQPSCVGSEQSALTEGDACAGQN